MNLVDILIISFIAIITISMFYSLFFKKKKTGCASGCSGCHLSNKKSLYKNPPCGCDK